MQEINARASRATDIQCHRTTVLDSEMMSYAAHDAGGSSGCNITICAAFVTLDGTTCHASRAPLGSAHGCESISSASGRSKRTAKVQVGMALRPKRDTDESHRVVWVMSTCRDAQMMIQCDGIGIYPMTER